MRAADFQYHGDTGAPVARAEEFKVVVNAASGAHYDCATLAEANEIFDNAPLAESGERLLTVDGVVVRREYLEVTV